MVLCLQAGALLVLLSSGVSGMLVGQEPVLDLVQIRDLVQKQEKAVRFVRGESYKTNVRVDPQGHVHRMGECKLDFVIEWHAAGRTRLDYEFMTGQHVSSKVFHRWADAVGYDGNVTWVLSKTRQEEGGPLLPMRSASVQSRRAAIATGYPETGFHCTLTGFYSDLGRPFLEALANKDAPWTIDCHGDKQVVRLAVGDRRQKVVHSWFLAQLWSYCLKRYERRSNDGALLDHFEVVEAVKIHPDLWYPTKVRGGGPLAGAPGQGVWELDVFGVQASNECDESVFAPRFPAGTVVTDLDTKEQVVMAPADAELGGKLLEQVRTMEQLILYEQPQRRWWQVVLAAVAGVAGVTLLLRRSKRPRVGKFGATPPAALAGLGCCLLAANAGAQEPWIMRTMPGCRADNCGVNCVALVAAFFGADVSLAEVEARLGCGESRMQAVSMSSLQACLVGMGLGVTAFRAQELEVVKRAFPRHRSLAILHVATGGPVPHYYVVGPGRKGLVIVDPGVHVDDHALDDRYAQRLAGGLTGIGLLVVPLTDLATRGIQDEERWEIDLGWMAGGERTVDLPVRNDSRLPLMLRAATSDCGCFRHAVLVPGVLPAGTAGKLRCSVDPARMGSEPKLQWVELQFDQGGQPLERRLGLRGARLEQGPAEVRPLVQPSLLFAKRLSDGVCHGQVTVLVPTGGRVAEWRGSEGVRAVSGCMEPVAGGVLVQFGLDWSESHAAIEFSVQDVKGNITRVSCILQERGEF